MKIEGISVQELNSFQKELRDLHSKYGLKMSRLYLRLRKGEYTITEPIALIKEISLVEVK